MPKNWYAGITPEEYFGGKKKKRKPFSSSTKRNELIKSKMKCRKCHRPLQEGGYDFDHRDNNPANNSQSNCMVLCKTCHGTLTKFKRIKVRDRYTGAVTGYKTIKRKVGLKNRKTKRLKKKHKKRSYDPTEIGRAHV